MKEAPMTRKVALSVVVIGVVALISACGQKTPQVTSAEMAAAIKAAKNVRSHYKKYPVGGGWHITSVTHKHGDVYAHLVMPERTALAIMKDPPSRQFPAIGLSCPNKTVKAWSLLDIKHTIYIAARGANDYGHSFIVVDCRRWGL